MILEYYRLLFLVPTFHRVVICIQPGAGAGYEGRFFSSPDTPGIETVTIVKMQDRFQVVYQVGKRPVRRQFFYPVS